MSLLLSPKQIAEKALRKIGHTAWFETGGKGQALAVAVEYLDLVVAELAGTEQVEAFVPRRMDVNLIAGQAEYDLAGLLDPDPMWITRAHIVDEAGSENEILLLTRFAWDAIHDRSTRTGTPCELYVRRGPSPLAYPYPIPEADTTLRLTAQTVAPDISSDSATHGLEAAWQLLLIDRLAAEIGDGPVEKLTEVTLRRYRADADRRLAALVARGSSPNVTQPRKVKADIYL